MENFKFNPVDYGFQPISEFPEIDKTGWFGDHQNVYCKIICLAGNEFEGIKEGDRLVYWFKAIKMPNTRHSISDKIKIYSSSYDSSREEVFTEFSYPTIEYSGLITTDSFASELLKHLMGTLDNKSVLKQGTERFNERIKR